MVTDLPMTWIETEDGSLTLKDLETGELYHNRAGAVTEALHNYVEPAEPVQLLAMGARLSVCDACFGLGYNSWVLLSYLACVPDIEGTVAITGLEWSASVIAALPEVLKQPMFDRVSQALGRTAAFGRISFKLTELLTVELELLQVDLRAALPELTADFDLVFHDPFSARKMPELWTVDLFKQYFRLLLAKQGRLLTYSAAAAVRGGLSEAGFSIWRTAAVGGKAGGTMACVPGRQPAASSFPLTSDEQSILFSRRGVPYRDPGLVCTRSGIWQARAQEQALRHP